jgi:hypothetical protein
MITSSKVLIGIFWLYVLLALMLNFYEGAAMQRDTDITDMAGYSSTTSTLDTGGNIATTIWQSVLDSPVGTVISWVNKYFLFDYLFFRDLNAVPDSDGQYPYNDFVLLRWLLVAIGIVLIIQIAISSKSALPFMK